ncbi:kinase-like domain-containing protein [Rhizophagus diaphanus]|nr:kinase-like domain-containing protein [Rhizophagus diaphanus] [Rhizophagus sp. MUCL 43196]
MGKPLDVLKPNFKKCFYCFYCKKKNPLDESHKIRYKCSCDSCSNNKELANHEVILICNKCYNAKTQFTPSGNGVIDKFIMETLDKVHGEMEFVSYNKFKNLEFIAEGGFSKIYKAIWENGPITSWNREKFKYNRQANKTIALKELNNSKDINSKELNEIKIFHRLCNYTIQKHDYKKYINKYYGITQHPKSKNYMIIMNYCESGDLTHYIAKNFFNIKWYNKLHKLCDIISGLKKIHYADIIHQDYHSGNIFMTANTPMIGDLGLSRRPFWDRSHDTDLIIEIFDGLRPPIITNAPDGYIKLMKKCWHSDPTKRPTAKSLYSKIYAILGREWKYRYIPTKIIESPDIGPITTTMNPNAIYKSRPLSTMIKSAENTINTKKIDKRKFDEFFENNEENDENDKTPKKLCVYENHEFQHSFINSISLDYLTKEFRFDISNDINKINKIVYNGLYISREIKFDI